MAPLKILLISVCSLIAGAAGICTANNGFASLPFASLFAIFGWFYLVPIYLLVALMWLLYRLRFTAMPWRLLFILLGAVLGGGLMALQGAFSAISGTDQSIRDGTILGGILAGGVCNMMIALIKPPEPGASPNVGPVGPPGNSGAGGGPPSVS